MKIHGQAIIHPEAHVHPSVVVKPFATIEANVTIDADTIIHSHAIIKSGTSIGINCEIHPGAIVGGEPQDLKYVGENTTLKIGHHTTIREYATINRGTKAQGYTQIGSHTLIMAYSHIAHDCVIGDSVVIANAVQLAGHVKISNYAIVSGMSAVQQFITIGESAYVGGGSMVRKDVPPYIKAAREPLSYAGANVVGLKRRGWNETRITSIQQATDWLMMRSHNLQKGIADMPTEWLKNPDIEHLITFIRNSKNGILKGYRA